MEDGQRDRKGKKRGETEKEEEGSRLVSRKETSRGEGKKEREWEKRKGIRKKVGEIKNTIRNKKQNIFF